MLADLSRSRPLDLDEFRRLVVPVFRMVFRDVDPFERPFLDAVASRLVLFPVNYQLQPDELGALAGAAAAVGDPGFFVVETEWGPHQRELLEVPPEWGPAAIGKEMVGALPPMLIRQMWADAARGVTNMGEYEEHPAWYVSLDHLDALGTEGAHPGFIVETCFVSVSGQWGVLVSHMHHAVVGGTEAFTEALTARFPSQEGWRGDEVERPPREQIISFLDDVKQYGSEPMSWLPEYLSHLYGQQEAAELLRRGGFTLD